MSEKIAEAVEKTVTFIDELTNPERMTTQEHQDFLDGLLDKLEMRYHSVSTEIESKE